MRELIRTLSRGFFHVSSEGFDVMFKWKSSGQVKMTCRIKGLWGWIHIEVRSNDLPCCLYMYRKGYLVGEISPLPMERDHRSLVRLISFAEINDWEVGSLPPLSRINKQEDLNRNHSDKFNNQEIRSLNPPSYINEQKDLDSESFR
jgi:hypothetical protein